MRAQSLFTPLALVLLASACSGDDTYITVTVDRRAAVHDAKSLEVTLTNSGSMYSHTLSLGEHAFPVTFTLSAPGRSGDLGITIDALDSAGTLVGRGTGTTDLMEMTATVTLDSADFVVNSEYANDQFLSTDYEAVGFQLAGSTSTGQWMATYRDECDTSGCQIYGRRFDSSGLPVFSELAAGDIQFSVSELPTTTAAISAVAAQDGLTLAFWDFTDPVGGARGIACRGIDAMGAATTSEVTLATVAADVVSAAGVQGGTPADPLFAVTWQEFTSGATPAYSVRGAIVTKACTTSGPAFALSASAAALGTFGATRPHVTANGQNVLFSWITDDNLWIRTSTQAGVLGTEMKILSATSQETIEHVRVSPWQSGFAIAVRWVSKTSEGPGRIELYRVTATGALMGNPILITDQSRSDFASNKGFSLAQRPDNALLVVWHVCETGPGLCDVFGRILRPTGAAVGEPFIVPTSTASEQINPSVIALADSFVAAWNDSSGEAPDRSGTAVRARILTPLYDDARGVHGATCGASAPGSPDCGEGLACAMGTDAVQRCYYVCQPPSCPTGGTCTTVDAVTSACTF